MSYTDEVSKIKTDFYTSLAGILLILIGGTLIALIIIYRVYKESNSFRMFSIKSITMCFVCLIIMTITVYMSRDIGNYFKDISNIKSETYVIDECQVIGQSNAGNPITFQNRSPKCQSLISEQVYFLTTFYSPINVGEVYKVIYLENTKIGRIIERLE